MRHWWGRGTWGLVAVAIALTLISTHALAATTVVVTPSSPNGWVAQTDGTAGVNFVSGPAISPLGTGSLQFAVGSDGSSGAQLRNGVYAGRPLANLTALSYSTYTSQPGSGGQAPYLILNLDWDSNGSVDDLLFFEPVYQNSAYSANAGANVPNQCGSNPGCVIVGAWQTWDAAHGGWWSLNEGAGGPPLDTLSSYLLRHPGATIANGSSSGGLRVVAGFGAAAWNNFVGHADALTIDFNNDNQDVVTYDFEPQLVSTVTPTMTGIPGAGGAPTDADQCKNGGWRQFTNPTFRNQGACVSFTQHNNGRGNDDRRLGDDDNHQNGNAQNNNSNRGEQDDDHGNNRGRGNHRED